jgi:hypothetical protein
MTSPSRSAHLIDCRSCRADAYGIAWPALRSHDGTLTNYARICEGTPIHSRLIAAIPSLLSFRRDITRSPAATIVTKSP